MDAADVVPGKPDSYAALRSFPLHSKIPSSKRFFPPRDRTRLVDFDIPSKVWTETRGILGVKEKKNGSFKRGDNRPDCASSEITGTAAKLLASITRCNLYVTRETNYSKSNERILRPFSRCLSSSIPHPPPPSPINRGRELNGEEFRLLGRVFESDSTLSLLTVRKSFLARLARKRPTATAFSSS